VTAAANSGEYVNSESALQAAKEADPALPEGLYEACLATGRTPTAGEVKMIYYTKVRGSCWWRCCRYWCCVVCALVIIAVVVHATIEVHESHSISLMSQPRTRVDHM